MGLKAMQSLQEKNKDRKSLSNEMCIFIVLNTASIQIIPTTVIAIRNSLGSNAPTAIMFPVWIATIFAAVAAILSAKLIIKRR
jgi:spore maturation protein A